MNDPHALHDLIAPTLTVAGALLRELGERTHDGAGIWRPPFSDNEQLAADRVAVAGEALGLRVSTDATGNLYLTLPAGDSRAKQLIVGSHLDAVPRGGNFDGLAGVVAGLAAVGALARAGARPRRDITVMGIRAEENAWFGAQHVGSRLALGTLDPGALDGTRRYDTGRTLREHIVEAGFDPGPFTRGEHPLDPRRIAAFIEVHIEQGPVLEAQGLPLGIVTGIRGNLRCSRCRCQGAYDHAGTVPRALRHDAVMAVAELVGAMDALWVRWLDEGRDLVLTFGQLGTVADAHGVTTIPGEVRFSFDARSHDAALLDALHRELLAHAAAIGERRGVRFDFGEFSVGAPAMMDEVLRERLTRGATELGIPHMALPSGAGHDAADFALAGVPSAMIFVRNANGSHNPDESMQMDDFGAAVRLLAWLLAGETDLASPRRETPVP